MNDARIARARLEGNVKGQRWLEAVHTLADRVRRRAARGVGECAESQSHSFIYNTSTRSFIHNTPTRKYVHSRSELHSTDTCRRRAEKQFTTHQHAKGHTKHKTFTPRTEPFTDKVFISTPRTPDRRTFTPGPKHTRYPVPVPMRLFNRSGVGFWNEVRGVPFIAERHLHPSDLVSTIS